MLSGCDFSPTPATEDQKPDVATSEDQKANVDKTNVDEGLPQEDSLSKVTYSNLSDAESRAFVKTVLKKYGFDNEKIENYFYYVDYFNSAVHNEGLTNNGFSVLKNFSRDGGYPYYNDKLQEKNIDFMGTNCRITSFSLLKELIEIDESKLLDSGDRTLLFDAAAIDNFPKPIFSDMDKKKFYTFFRGMPTPRTKDRETHLATIEKYWQKHGINIKEKDGLSLIMLLNHSELDDVLFIGHIGVLMKADNGKYVFLEKLSFDLPYQAVIFDKKSQVYDYFMKKYGNMTSPETVDPFLMENGKLFLPE